jgi:hypothetical protein
MTPLGIFRRKEKEQKEEKGSEKTKKVTPTPAQTKKTVLEDLVKGDKELYDALSRTLLISLETTKSSGEMDARIEKAQQYEKNKDYIRARVEYQVAGELALYEGKTAQVQKLFKKAAEVDPSFTNKNVFEFLAKKENAEKAVAVAHEYYTRTTKTSI